jgi:hypothetical protein
MRLPRVLRREVENGGRLPGALARGSQTTRNSEGVWGGRSAGRRAAIVQVWGEKNSQSLPIRKDCLSSFHSGEGLPRCSRHHCALNFSLRRSAGADSFLQTFPPPCRGLILNNCVVVVNDKSPSFPVQPEFFVPVRENGMALTLPFACLVARETYTVSVPNDFVKKNTKPIDFEVLGRRMTPPRRSTGG